MSTITLPAGTFHSSGILASMRISRFPRPPFGGEVSSDRQTRNQLSIAAGLSELPPRRPRSAACWVRASPGCAPPSPQHGKPTTSGIASRRRVPTSIRSATTRLSDSATGRSFCRRTTVRPGLTTAAFPDAENITFSCLLKNGNILFATREKLFLSTDNLKTHRQIIVKNREGRDYLPHTPQKRDQPGWYFHPLDGVHTWDIDGSEMLVWGNYCNVLGGPVPVNIYYSTDSGQTVKIAYSFGRNPDFQEKGTEPGSFLGDPGNPVIARHIHAVAYHPAERAFYACTGDINRGHGTNATGCAGCMTRGPTHGTGGYWCR